MGDWWQVLLISVVLTISVSGARCKAGFEIDRKETAKQTIPNCKTCELEPNCCYCRCRKCDKPLFYPLQTERKVDGSDTTIVVTNYTDMGKVPVTSQCKCDNPSRINPRPDGFLCRCPGTSWGKYKHSETCAEEFLLPFLEHYQEQKSSIHYPVQSPASGYRPLAEDSLLVSVPKGESPPNSRRREVPFALPTSDAMVKAGAGFSSSRRGKSNFSGLEWMETMNDAGEYVRDSPSLPCSSTPSFPVVITNPEFTQEQGFEDMASIVNVFMECLELPADSIEAKEGWLLTKLVSQLSDKLNLSTYTYSVDKFKDYSRRVLAEAGIEVSIRPISQPQENCRINDQYYIFYYLDGNEWNVALVLINGEKVILIRTPENSDRDLLLHTSIINNFIKIFSSFENGYLFDLKEEICGAYLLQLEHSPLLPDSKFLWHKATQELRDCGFLARPIVVSYPIKQENHFSNKKDTIVLDVRALKILSQKLPLANHTLILHGSEMDIREIALFGANELDKDNPADDMLALDISLKLHKVVRKKEDYKNLPCGDYLILSPSKVDTEPNFTAIAKIGSEEVLLAVITISKQGDFNLPPMRNMKAGLRAFKDVIEELLQQLEREIIFYKRIFP